MNGLQNNQNKSHGELVDGKTNKTITYLVPDDLKTEINAQVTCIQNREISLLFFHPCNFDHGPSHTGIKQIRPNRVSKHTKGLKEPFSLSNDTEQCKFLLFSSHRQTNNTGTFRGKMR